MKHAIFLSAGIFCAAILPSHADELRYEAHWSEGAGTSLHTAPLPLDAFQETGQDLASSGLVLVDTETAVLNGRRVFAGLWTQGSGATAFAGPMGPVPMRQEMERRRGMGQRLVDFEIFRRQNGGRLYIGVWRPGSGEEILTGPMREDAFLSRGESLINDESLHLRDVEIEVIDGELFYSGLFRSGAGLNAITTPMPLDQLLQEQDALLEDGLELLDMERVGGGAENSFVGVWRSGDDPAEITSPRSFGQQFVLAQSQFNAGRRTLDFELQRIATPQGGDGGGGVAPPPLPSNPDHVQFVGGHRLRLEFTHIDDQPFTLELPIGLLPDWLPEGPDGPVLPDTHCGLVIRKADRIFWQVPGDPDVDTPPFLAIPSVFALGDEFFLGGVQFSGPIGGCTGTQKHWDFPFPFTTSGPFEPLPNMSLVIEIRQNGEIDFIVDTGPTPKPIDPDKLFKDESKEKLRKMIEFWNELFEEGDSVDDYCKTVGNFWTMLCSQFPTDDENCPMEVESLPNC